MVLTPDGPRPVGPPWFHSRCTTERERENVLPEPSEVAGGGDWVNLAPGKVHPRKCWHSRGL